MDDGETVPVEALDLLRGQRHRHAPSVRRAGPPSGFGERGVGRANDLIEEPVTSLHGSEGRGDRVLHQSTDLGPVDTALVV